VRQVDAAGVLSTTERPEDGAGERGADGAGERPEDGASARDAEGAAERSASAALLSVAPGLALPVFADPRGVLVVSGLPESHLGIRLQ
jgi:hypothetical protein